MFAAPGNRKLNLVKCHIVSILGSVFHLVSVTATQLCWYSLKAATGKQEIGFVCMSFLKATLFMDTEV